MDGARLEPGKRAEFLLTGVQGGERLARPRGEQASRLGEAAAAAVAFDQSLPCRRLEQAQVLARGRLADPDAPRGGGDGPLPLDLDEEAKARRIPEE